MGHGRKAALAALALGLGAIAAVPATAQTPVNPARVGNSASLSSGAPITAPDTVDPGAAVNVVVGNAQAGSQIALWGPVTQQGRGSLMSETALVNGSAELTAPLVPGSYELRYIGASGSVLGRRAFDVAAVPVTLTVPTDVGTNGRLAVTWNGPANPGDHFEVVGPGGQVLASAPAEGSPEATNTTEIPAPQQTGTMTLRYVASGGTVLRSIPFEVRAFGG